MISQPLAQKVVDKIMEDITYNINVMDNKAIIIASGQKERIGTIHQGARTVLKTRKRNIIMADTETEKQGINDPLVVDDQLIGVIGISGVPDEVEPLKNIVNTLFYFLVEQELEISRGHAKEKAISQFWETVLKPQVSYHQKLQMTAADLGYNLTIPSLIIGVKLAENKLTEEMIELLVGQLYIRKKSKNRYFILFQETKELTLETFLTSLSKEPTLVSIVYSSWNYDIYTSYLQANATLDLMEVLNSNTRVVSQRDYRLYTAVILHKNTLYDHETTGRLSHVELELKETLQCYIRNNGQINDTAHELNIHRNTLNYRLNRLTELTKKDPRCFFGLSDLLYELILENSL